MSTHATNIAYKEIVNQLVMARRKTLNVNQAIHLSSAQLTNTLQQRLDDLQISNNSPQYVAGADAWFKVFTLQKRDRVMLEIIQEEITRICEMSNEDLFDCFGEAIDVELRGGDYE